MIVRNVKKEDLKAVSEIAVNGWQKAYRGIIDDEFLDSLSIIEDEYITGLLKEEWIKE